MSHLPHNDYNVGVIFYYLLSMNNETDAQGV